MFIGDIFLNMIELMYIRNIMIGETTTNVWYTYIIKAYCE